MIENDLSPASIAGNLRTKFIGRKLFYYPEVTSTMDVAREEARRGATEGTVILADKQTASKGRLKRVWLSPSGNIALSIILYPALEYLPCLIMVASLAVVHSIEAVTGLKAQIKWPNDVLIKGKKVCGILIENDARGNKVFYSITGIGINANIRLSDFPEIMSTSTSLSDEVGRDISRVELIQSLLAETERLYPPEADGDSVYQEWKGRLVTLGRKVRVTSGEMVLEGIAESVDRDGSLLLRRADGSETRIVAGDVTLRDYK